MSFRIARFSTKFFAMRQRSSETSHAPLIDSNACRDIVGENLFPAETRPQSVILPWRSRICKTKPTSHLLSATRWEWFWSFNALVNSAMTKAAPFDQQKRSARVEKPSTQAEKPLSVFQ